MFFFPPLHTSIHPCIHPPTSHPPLPTIITVTNPLGRPAFLNSSHFFFLPKSKQSKQVHIPSILPGFALQTTIHRLDKQELQTIFIVSQEYKVIYDLFNFFLYFSPEPLFCSSINLLLSSSPHSLTRLVESLAAVVR